MKHFLFISLCILFRVTAQSQNPVAENGRLQVIGHQLCNQQGKAYQLKGMSMFGLMHYPQCITSNGFKALRHDWNSNVVRATVFVADYSNTDNYNQNPEFNKRMVDSMVRWSEREGMYCIIDWHVLNPGDPDSTIYGGAAAFFEEMSAKYKDKKHIIYEICNEPNGKNVTWDSVAKYANRIIPIIRKNDPQSVILIGTPDWCKDLTVVDPSKINDTKNVMYTFHFYAASHAYLYASFVKHIHRIPVFASEWGVCIYNGDGIIDSTTSNKYLNAMKQHVLNGDTVSISWCNFSYADKNESASALKPGSCYNGAWNNTTTGGNFIKRWMLYDGPNNPVTLLPEQKNIQKKTLLISPNPVIDMVSIECPDSDELAVSIYSLSGKEMIAPVKFKSNITISLKSLSKGIYILRCEGENDNESRFFVKE